MAEKITKTEDQWMAELTPEQYQICRRKGTERPFSGEYNGTKTAGVYACVCCGEELFDSEAKFDSGSGWPSFRQPIAEDRVKTETDSSLGMVRNEVTCARCDSHLGHVFDDGPRPTGRRYCLNSVSLSLRKR